MRTTAENPCRIKTFSHPLEDSVIGVAWHPAKLFGVTVDDLVGMNGDVSKRGPTPQLQQQIEKLSRLPKAKQKTVMEMIEGVLSQASR